MEKGAGCVEASIQNQQLALRLLRTLIRGQRVRTRTVQHVFFFRFPHLPHGWLVGLVGVQLLLHQLCKLQVALIIPAILNV